MSLVVRATPAEIDDGRELSQRVSEVVGGREFVLVVDCAPDDPDEAGDIYSNMKDGHDFIRLLETALESSLVAVGAKQEEHGFTASELLSLMPNQVAVETAVAVTASAIADWLRADGMNATALAVERGEWRPKPENETTKGETK